MIAANFRPALTAVGPLIPSLRADLNLSATTAGSITAIPLLTFAIVAWAAPRLSRRLGVNASIIASLTVLTAGILIRSLGGPFLLFAGTIALAAGIGVCNVMLPVLVRSKLPRRVGTTTSWYTATQAGVSALAAGLAVPIALVAPGGWRSALACWAILAAATALVLTLAAVRRRSQGHIAPPSPIRRNLGTRVWRSPLAWKIAVMMALQSIGFYSIVTWMPTVFISQSGSEISAGMCLLVFQFVALGASLTLPIVLRLGTDQRLAAGIAAGMYCVGFLGLAFAPSAAWVWAVVAGIGSGMSLPLVLTLISLRSPDPGHAMSLSSMAQSVGYLGAALGPITVGALNDLTGTWVLPMLVLAAAAVAQLVVGISAGRNRMWSDGEPLMPSPRSRRPSLDLK